jgi:hypothetical protein
MPDLAPITSETLARMSRELTSPAVPDSQLPPVVEMLNGLAADMADCRRFQVGEAEPVLVYNPEVAQ